MPLDFPSSPTPGQVYLNWTWNGTAWIVVPGPPLASAAQSAQNSGRNYLDNALFNVQQRGAGPFSTTLSYTADRWQLFVNTDTVNVSVIALTDAQRTAIGDESAIYGLNPTFTGSSGAAAFNLLAQKIEKLHRLSGKTITISFFAVSPQSLRLGVSCDQIFGSGGSPSATILGAGQAVQLTATFARYSLTFNLPSTAGQTFGTNGDDYTQINFWNSSGVNQAVRTGNIGVQTGTIALWGMQVEIGSQATPLEKLVPEVDLARCQRFLIQMNCAFIGNTVAGSTAGQTYTFPVQMRASPTVTIIFSNDFASGGFASPRHMLGINPNNITWGGTVNGSSGNGGFNDGLYLSADL